MVWKGRVFEIGRATLHGMPAFADVEDDTACKDGMDHTGQPESP